MVRGMATVWTCRFALISKLVRISRRFATCMSVDFVVTSTNHCVTILLRYHWPVNCLAVNDESYLLKQHGQEELLDVCDDPGRVPATK